MNPISVSLIVWQFWINRGKHILLENPHSDCPVCRGKASLFYSHQKQKRRFLLSVRTALWSFRRSLLCLSRIQERERYSLHQNSPNDQGYIQWLERFIQRGILPWYIQGHILDFGSGPEPVLTQLLKKFNPDVYPFDKYFAPRWPENIKFSLVVLSEVLEHLDDPVEEFRRIGTIAEKGCILTLQTSFLRNFDSKTFSVWWYKDDITHKRFYCASSLLRLGLESGWNLIYQDGTSIAVYKKCRDRF